MYSGNAKWLFISVAAFLSLFLLAKALHEFRQFGNEGRTVYPSNTISVTGEGKANATPNIASFSFSVIEEGATVPEAQKLATDKGNKAISFLKSNGIEDKDIKTTGYSINPNYEFERFPCNTISCPPEKKTLKGYEVSQSVNVKVRKTEDAGKILSGIGSLSVQNVSGLQFTLDDEDALKTEARIAAIGNAQTKVDELSKALHVKVVRVVSFTEGSQPIPYYAKAQMANDERSTMSAPAPAIPSGENTITSSVTITYEIK